jgi:hypothetical protein
LFLREDGLVGCVETENFERARAGMAQRQVNERWQREMGDFFVQPDGALPDRLPQMLVIAAGGCELKTRGKKYQLFTPKVVRDPTRRPFPFTGRLVLTIVGADEYMELST